MRRVALLLCLSVSNGFAQTTPLRTSDLDPVAYAEWYEGIERAIKPADEKDASRKPEWVMWRQDGAPSNKGFTFGSSKIAGPRHLRVGFNVPISVGSVLVRGGGRLSVLKPGVAYPGNLGDDSQWVPAERLDGRLPGHDAVGKDTYALWVLPQVAFTRALRFTHDAQSSDKEFAGWLGGAYVLSARVANIAPQAWIIASSNEKSAYKTTNEMAESGWMAWDNVPLSSSGSRAMPVSTADPEWVMLIWPQPVKIGGIAAIWAGFSDADVQVYIGSDDIHPREAPQDSWRTIKSFTGLKNRYPLGPFMGIDWLDFGHEETVRALRLRITKVTDEGQSPHTKGHVKKGNRVWLGDLMALHPLGNAPLAAAVLPEPEQKEKPPIAIKFTLPEAGLVTLVVEDESGKRVRNLVADTPFGKGKNTAWWDGSDDLGRDYTAPKHGVYLIPTRLVQPGNYRVRGLWHKPVKVKYETGLYSAGVTPWETADQTGGWLANHTPPNAVLYVPNGGNGKPSIMIGSYVSEGTAGLAWVDLDGRKWKGQKWLGGAWTGAAYLARDLGPQANPDVMAYAASVWTAESNVQTAKGDLGDLRLTAITPAGDKSVLKHRFKPPAPVPAAWAGAAKWKTQIGGLTVHNGTLVVSMTQLNQLLFVDAKSGKITGEVPLEQPRGLIFDPQGRLLVISGKSLVRYQAGIDLVKPGPPGTLPYTFEEPEGITVDARGNIYVSDRGQSHQVKVFNDQGQPVRSIGKPGAPRAGLYDPLHMNKPSGLTVDPSGRLWVAEEDTQPKRVSVWNPDGTLWRAFYGPPGYGGGGNLDPRDKTRYFYQGMEIKLDWENGTSEVVNVFYRGGAGKLPLGYRSASPQTPIYREKQRYFTNCFNSNPTNGHGTAFLFIQKDNVAVPIAAAGNAAEWSELAGDAFAKVWPQGTERAMFGGPNSPRTGPASAFFLWSDLNADAKVQPEEVQMTKGRSGGVTVMDDLSFVVSRIEDKAVRFAPARFSPAGAPIYNLADGEVLAVGINTPPSTGGDQVLAGPGGWNVFTTAPKPFSGHSIGGTKGSTPVWSYPSLWPGLHASHEAPVPDRPGMLQGTTRVLGNFISPGGEPMWMLNGNHGPVYVFTADGLFVTQIFQDMRVGRQWSMPKADRGMDVTDLTPSDENFWPSPAQMQNGEVYMVAGRPNSVVKVEGLDSVKRIEPIPISVSAGDLAKALEYFTNMELERRKATGSGVLTAAIRQQPPVVDGKMDDWATADWVDIDKRGAKAYFNSDSKPYDVTGAVAVSGDTLYAAWKTGNPDLLDNNGSVPNAPFKTGGALDLMIGSNPAADPKRDKPVEGDLRLLITKVKGKTLALVYRAVVSGQKSPVPFASPVWTVTFDRVDDVSEQVQLAAADGNFEIAVPLSILGLKPAPDLIVKGDIGILRGGGGVTTQRVYWTNKATAIVSDVPSEAMLQPGLWGRWEFKVE